jgi:hypothetical protein
MPQPKGCLKSCALGCAGFAALLVIGGVIISTLAWKALNGGDDKRPLAENAVSTVVGAVNEPMSARAARLTTTQGGRVRLVLGEGEFRLRPAGPGEGLHARAEYDSTRHRLTELFTVLPDSTWEYHLDCRQVGSSSFLKQLFGGERNNAKVTVYLPAEVPIDLVLEGRRGGCDADLGGLWLRTGDIRFHQGGIELEFSSPLREPMESLRLQARMGGIAAKRVGNASPRALDIDCAMGGGDFDLRGAWPASRCLQRCGSTTLTGSTAEVPAPVLRPVDPTLGSAGALIATAFQFLYRQQVNLQEGLTLFADA